MGQAADVRSGYEALRAALLEDGLRGPLAHLRLAGSGRTSGALLCGAPAGSLAKALGEGQRLRIQGIPFPDLTPPDERTPAFLERLDAVRAEDAGWTQRVAEAEETGIEDALVLLDRRLRDTVRRDLGLGPRHVLPPSLEDAAEAAGISADIEVGEGQALSLPLRLRQEADRAVQALARLAEQDATNRRELGLATLHLALGILSWGGPDGRRTLSTPLLLLPITLETGPGGGWLRAAGPLLPNPLARILLEGARISLPDAALPPAAWLDALAETVRALPGTRLRRVAALANLNLADVLLWRDSDPALWQGRPWSRPLVARYLGGTGPEGPGHAVAPVLPLPSDATQRAVVARAAAGGSCVVEGPPGAGKSQTIVNAIVQALLARRSVWVVAEKRAAVDVVGQRLAALGLSALTLDLHGGGKDGVRRLTEVLRQRFDLAAAAPPDPGPAPHDGHPSEGERDEALLHGGETWLEAVPARARLAAEGLEGIAAPGPDPAAAARLGAMADALAAETPPRAPSWSWISDGAAPDAVVGALDALAAALADPSLDGAAGAGPARARLLAGLPEEDHPAIAAARLWGPGCLTGDPPPAAPLHAPEDLHLAVEAGLGEADAAAVAALARRWAEENRADAARAEWLRRGGADPARPDPETEILSERLRALPAFLRAGANKTSIEEICRLLGSLSPRPEDIDLDAVADAAGADGFLARFSSARRHARRRLRARLGDDGPEARRRAKALARYARLQAAHHLPGPDAMPALLAEARALVAEAERRGTTALEALVAWDGVWPGAPRPAEALRRAAVDRPARALAAALAAREARAALARDLGIAPDAAGDADAALLASARAAAQAWPEEAWNLLDARGMAGLLAAGREGRAGVAAWARVLEALKGLSWAAGASVPWPMADAPALRRAVAEARSDAATARAHALWRTRVAALPEAAQHLLAALPHPPRSRAAIAADLARVAAAAALPLPPPRRPDAPAPAGASWPVAAVRHRWAALPPTGPGLRRLRQLSTQRRPRGTLHELLGTHWEDLARLFPVLLLDPTTIAASIPRDAVPGLALLDEASQMRPADALPVLLRAPQALIFGDSRQLAPSAFFRARLPGGGEIAESVLEQAYLLGEPEAMRWHYRSQASSLVAFSNARFYDGGLVVLPSAFDGRPGWGVERIDAGGTYDRSRNPVEAARMVGEALAIVQAAADAGRIAPSIGMVAMNEAQADLVRRTLEEESGSAWRRYAAWWEQRQQEPFVRALENVQGDERDVILVSTTYGPGPDGRQRNAFGPLSQADGWRRLNVLLTRARQRMVLITSLRTAEIPQDGGGALLRAALEAARAPQAAEPPTHARGFAAWLGARLEAAGFEVVPGLGVGADRLFLGVRTPQGGAAAVEPEGMPAHLDPEDRQHLRPVLLRRLGWTVLPVAPDEAWADPEGLVRGLVEAARRAPPPAHPLPEAPPEEETPAEEEGDLAPDAEAEEDPPQGTEEEWALPFRARLRYRDAEGEETEREIEARLLFLRDGRPEMLAAWCRLREDLRHFRIDRMAALRPEGEDGWIEGPEAVAAFLAARWTAIPAVAWKRWRGGPGAGAWTALVALARADQRLSMAERQMLGRILAGLFGVPGAEAQIDADLRLARFSAAEARAAAAAVAADPMAPRIREAARQVRALARSPHPEQDALLSTILGDAPEP